MPAERLRDRLVSSVIAALVLLGIFLLAPRLAGAAVLATLVLAGAWEWAGFLPRSNNTTRVVYLLTVALALGLAWAFARMHLTPILWIALGWWLLAFFWVLRFPTPIPRWLVMAGGLFVLVPGWLALASLHVDVGPAWLIYFFIVIAAADTGAYFSGRAFGRTKLAPRVSPGKTWEGAIGGLVVVAAVGFAGSLLLNQPLLFLVPLSIAVGMASIVGDLTMSMFKRHAGLKDSGRLFPGHGGILDRIDSIAAGAPLFMLGVGWTALVT
ncbi:MAG: phosphatidate cytidylyltransferase [Gammaproteobacteria bacterium]|nr:phosphatidate cytidylyltransferase [Gammaproteobacteria bacterium]